MGGKVKVLVVDDAASNRTVLSALLKRVGHEVETAADVVTAEKLFASAFPESVLTDLHLGNGEDGIALATSLRRLAENRTVRIGLMTADASVSVPDGIFDALLEKPVTLDNLMSFLGGDGQ